jgi:hypothetical protein
MQEKTHGPAGAWVKEEFEEFNKLACLRAP